MDPEDESLTADSLKWRDKLTTNAILRWDPPKEAGSALHFLYQVEYRRGFDAWVGIPLPLILLFSFFAPLLCNFLI